jgi:ABC-type phosphate transport system substrate-binding protein
LKTLRHFLVVLSFLCATFLISTGDLAADVGDLVIIVNAKSSTDKISISQLRDFYYKKRRTWPNGESVRFIDRSKGSPIREKFLSTVLKKTEEELELYWIGQKLYSGDSAPLQESADAMTVHFVSSFPGAIGYVSSTTSLKDKNVKPVGIE